MTKRFTLLTFALTAIALSVVAGDAAAIADTLPNPLKHAKVGQWVQYRINTLFGTAEQKQTLTAIEGEGDDRVLTIKSEMYIDDELVDERSDSITYQNAMAEQEKALQDSTDLKVKNTTLDFKGAKIDAVEVDFVQEEKRCVLFLSENVPLVGMIRMEMEGETGPVMELLDFGE